MKIFTNLITPFKEDGIIDYQAVDVLIKRLAFQKNHCFIIGSFTGEGMFLNPIELKHLVRYICYHYDLEIYVYILQESTKKAIEQINELNDIKGLSGYIIKVPNMVRYSNASIYKHIDLISVVSDKKIIIDFYHRDVIESQVFNNLQQKHSNIYGVITEQDLDDSLKIKKYIHDKNVLKMHHNYDGIISDISNIDYQSVSLLNENEVNKDYFSLLVKYFYRDNISSSLKYILSKKGYINYRLRLPLVKIDSDLEKQLNKLMEKY